VVDAGGLWNHQVVIKSLELEKPAISLLSDLKGDWNFNSQPLPTKPAPDPPGEKPLITLGVISNVKISKGKLSVANLLPSGQPGPVFIEADEVSSQLRQVDLNAFTESASISPGAVTAEPLAGCGKTLHGCHPERSEGSRSAYLLENAQGQILRFAQNDSLGGFSRSLAALSGDSWLSSVAYAADRSGTLVAEGTFEVATLHVMNLVVTNVRSKFRLFPKQVLFEDLGFKLYDGGGGGNLSFAFAGPNSHYSTQAKLSGVNVAKLLDAFPDARGKLTGTLDGTVGLDAQVSHSPDPLAGVGASGHMAIRNGRLPTLQLDKNLLQLARVAEMGPASGDPSSFSSLAVDFTIANNRINTSKTTIVGNGVEVDASGSLALAGKGSLDYQGVATVATSQNALTSLLGGLAGTTVKGGKMAFPFHLTGTLENPRFTLSSNGK